MEKDVEYLNATEDVRYSSRAMKSSTSTESPNVEPLKESNLKPKSADELEYDKGYCWVVCFACFLLNASAWGMNTAWAVYYAYYVNNKTYPGTNDLEFGTIGGLAFGATITFTPVINYLQGRIGTRPTIILGNFFQCIALILASFTSRFWELILTQGLMLSVGLALVTIPNTTIIPQFFRKKRVLASGIATAGTGAGGVFFNLALQKMVERLNVHWAMRIQALISFVLVWVAVILYRSRSKNHRIEFSVFDVGIMKMYGFWLLVLFIILCILPYVIVLYMLAHYTTSLGYSEYQGSIASAMILVGSIIGRPIVGFLADRKGPSTLLFLTYLLSGILCLAMWIPARNYATVVAFGVLIGALSGSFWAIFAPLLARVVGIRKMNNAFSMVWSVLGMIGIVAPVVGSSLVRQNDSGKADPTQYLYCSIFCGVSFLGCSIVLLVLRGYLLARDIVLKDFEGGEFSQEQGYEILLAKVPFKDALAHCFDIRNVKA